MDFRMDLDTVDSNAEAGPSNASSHHQHAEASSSAMAMPSVILPPSPHPVSIPPFSAAQDLLGHFQLQAAYDKYVKPHVLPVDRWQSADGAGVDKGKGREKDGADADANMEAVSPSDPSGNSEEGKKRKKESSYRHLIKAVVGKHSMKKDTYLVDMISVPPKQKMEIKKFDEKTQNDAFWVSPEGLKGYNIHTLIPPSEQAREDRKRRKEAKKAEKARLAAVSVVATETLFDQGGQPAMQAPTPMTNGAPTPAPYASTSSVASSGGGKTDRMTTNPQNTQSRPNGKVAGVSTPTSQRPGTPVNRQAGANPPQRSNTPSQQQVQQRPSQQQFPTQRPQPTPTQSRAPVHAQTQQTHNPDVIPRGTKRDRPDTPVSQHHPPHTHSAPSVFSNHHGMVGHPSTAKKRRLESATAVR